MELTKTLCQCNRASYDNEHHPPPHIYLVAGDEDLESACLIVGILVLDGILFTSYDEGMLIRVEFPIVKTRVWLVLV